MSFYCNGCKNIFSEPARKSDWFHHKYGVSKRTTLACPFCESTEIEEAVPCGTPRCNTGFMHRGERICLDCRRDLLFRVCAFFGELSDEEIAVFDNWMDGNSITDRGCWT